MKEIETLKKACFAIESEWGEKEADEYFTALFRLKEDLEVLEIIKNKDVRLKSLEFYLRYYIDLESVLKAYNFSFIQLTLEELLKLKQWLEENE